MRKLGLVLLVVRGLAAQTFSPCDVNRDGVVNTLDVQITVSQALGLSACTTGDVDHDGVCNVVDAQWVISAALGGSCGPSAPAAPSQTQLPVEVIGLDGTIKTVSFGIPAGTNLSGALTLSMRIHGLRYQTQASVQVNNAAWTPINSSSVTLLGNANAYGGIGGGFHTLAMTMALPAGALTAGTNTLSFRFNGTDGRVSGFRVLAFNISDSSGNALLPASTFVNEDPNTWQPPSTLASDISSGKTLWYTAPLIRPTPAGPAAIQAHCTDCHAQDGRDLKYFNYSNNSIRTRSMFHGLTAQQGDQIASYIRSLSVVNPGRPWNPAYQPGPGLDSHPVLNWSAGAGIDAVLDNDQALLNEIFPSGVQASVFSANGNLNVRETRIPVQLTDWNQWLPGTAPVDSMGSTFLNSGYNTLYQTIRSQLKVLDPVAYGNQVLNLSNWMGAGRDLIGQLNYAAKQNPSLWTPQLVDSVYSMAQWGTVKQWEMMNEFQLEGFAQNIFGPQADPRAWYGNLAFVTSPGMQNMPTSGVAGLRNGSQAVFLYLAFVWYHEQLILNNSNKKQTDWHPIDWPYTYGHINGMGHLLSPQAALHTLWLIKALQISNNGVGPQYGQGGWEPSVNDVSLLISPEGLTYEWPSVPSATQVAIYEGFLTSWLAQVKQFTPQQFYTGNWTTATAVPATGYNWGAGWVYGSFVDKIWYMIPRFRYFGVNQTLINEIAAWAQTMWPNANWALTTTATCSPASNSVLVCSQ
jgi:hypothetical protein